MSKTPAWTGAWDTPDDDRPAIFSQAFHAPAELFVPRVKSLIIDRFEARVLEELSVAGDSPRVLTLPVEAAAPVVLSYRFHAPAVAPRKPETTTEHAPHKAAQHAQSQPANSIVTQDAEIPLPELPDTLDEELNADEPETIPFVGNSKVCSAAAMTQAAEGKLENCDVEQSEARNETPALPTVPKYTRLQPPGEVIKMEDRLFYLLQPALETLLVEKDLHFPFHPFPYQMQGMAFLFPRRAAMLADEMGLGKTMQAISGIRLLLHAGEARNILLVCPKPLVSNWKREFALWAPELPIAIIEGDAGKRQWLWEQGDCPIKIANYESLCRDKDLVCDGAQHFDLVVLDESQRIKNQSSTTAKVVRSLSRTRSWALTGTPVENSPDDLVGIFEFVSPGLLNTDMKPKALGQTAGDYILRRTKDAVLTEMPPKLYSDAHVELHPAQLESYRMAEDEGVLQLNEMGESATIQHVFELVLRLKQICNFDPLTGNSSKYERLEADMEEIAASGHKAILFSQWTHTIAKLKTRLARFGVCEYHGGIPHKQREGVIQNFKDDPNKHIILMSYGAGSVGLNLQFCRYVFLFDRWWNPAVEDQAINRAHRIGAVGTVTVTRFVAMNTIEERINQVLEEKRAMFDVILGNAEEKTSNGLNAHEIFGLFKLKCPAGPIKFAA